MTYENMGWARERRAVDLAKKSVPEPNRAGVPYVGVVVVKGGAVLGEGWRGQRNPGDHAEYCALKGIPEDALRDAIVYTTLEPCTHRGPGKEPCAKRLIESGVSEVCIGLYDPNPRIFRQGWRILRDAGIHLSDFSPELRAELREVNRDFLDQYRVSVADSGHACFDYIQHDEFTLGKGTEIRTTWSPASHGIIWAYGGKGLITLARFANSFDEIHDPGALDFQEEEWQVGVNDGEIVVFGNLEGSYALVKVQHVLARSRGDDRDELAFEYEIRTPSAKSHDL